MSNSVFTIRGPSNELDKEKRDKPQDRLLKLIPGETVTLYAVATTMVAESADFDASVKPYFFLFTFVFCLLLTILIRVVETKDPETKKPQKWNIIVSSISFVLYAYTIGGPFRTALYEVPPGWRPVFGTFASLFWTAALPWLYRAAGEPPPDMGGAAAPRNDEPPEPK